jgi:SacI restriction endonuclease
MPIDNAAARKLLNEVFEEVDNEFQRRSQYAIEPNFDQSLSVLFKSNTQAYRETLVGSILARIQDRSISLSLPYAKLDDNAYNGRDLDEAVVNPFLKAKQIPSSKGPFLSVFRRSVRFVDATESGLRDKKGYRAFLTILRHIQSINSDQELRGLLRVLLYRFLALREASRIEIAKVERLSIPQYTDLIDGLLSIRSGGRFPVFIVVAVLRALGQTLCVPWKIEFQGINVADAPGQAAGDITVSLNGRIFMAAEVTERDVDKSRVASTFASKIAPGGIRDYLFFVRVKKTSPDEDAMRQAQQYFVQGHEVNFVDVRLWALHVLATIGAGGRHQFNVELEDLLNGEDVPRKMKVAWNDHIQNLTRI